jgi:hypothetical protein
VTVPVSRTPTLAEVIRDAIESSRLDLRVGIPAEVQDYDAPTQKVSVRPLLQNRYTQEDGTEAVEALPVINDVPVIFPGGGGFRLTFPITRGDTVWLQFADRSLDTWLQHGDLTDPDDTRNHSLADAVAIPCIKPFNAPWRSAHAVLATLGPDIGPQITFSPTVIDLGGGSTDFVAMAAQVLGRLNVLMTLLTTWVPAPGDGGLALKTAAIAAALTPAWTASIASTTVKVKG